jgi:hypothetical protein
LTDNEDKWEGRGERRETYEECISLGYIKEIWHRNNGKEEKRKRGTQHLN